MLAAAAAIAPVEAAPDDAIYTRPGQIVEAEGARLNLYCMGNGSPAVILDAGHQDWAPAWSVIQPQVATWTRVCSFDRPGYGFSPPGPMPRTSERIARELHVALHAIGVTGPYVLVGHAFGTTNLRTFASLYPDEVQGLVLIDPDPDPGTPEQVAREHSVFIHQAIEIQRCGETLAARVPQPPELACDKRFFRGFPEPGWSTQLNEALSKAVHTRPDLSDVANAELEQIPLDELWLQQHRASLGSRPVRVITAGQHKPQTIAAQAALLAVTSNGKQIIASHSRNAYVQFDEPKLVIDAIREVSGQGKGTQFRDCPRACPEMVMLPQGSFIMGSPPGEVERERVPNYFRGHSIPQHPVAIAYGLALSKYAVTRDEYAQFVAATKRPDPDSCYVVVASGGEENVKGANWHSPGFPQTGRDPVVCVSWDDAQAYAAWLSAKTGHTYRLPTEAEWEYAARAGTTTARYSGDSPANLCRFINHADLDYSAKNPRDSDVNRECHDGFAFTSPVGSFAPNLFGLYDMLGNVWQWTEDCWNEDYRDAPSDGSSWKSGNCSRRVVRGGAYSNVPGLVLSAVRNGYRSSGRDHSQGFRVARTF